MIGLAEPQLACAPEVDMDEHLQLIEVHGAKGSRAQEKAAKQVREMAVDPCQNRRLYVVNDGYGRKIIKIIFKVGGGSRLWEGMEPEKMDLATRQISADLIELSLAYPNPPNEPTASQVLRDIVTALLPVEIIPGDDGYSTVRAQVLPVEHWPKSQAAVA